MFNFNSFYFYFSTYFNSIFSFIFIFLTTTLGHKQALTSPCEGVQLINEVETPRLQGLAADEAKMFYLWSQSICSQDGFLVFQEGFFVLLFPMVLPNIPGECWLSQWTFLVQLYWGAGTVSYRLVPSFSLILEHGAGAPWPDGPSNSLHLTNTEFI